MDAMGLEDPQRGGQGVVDPGRIDRFDGLGKTRQLECIAGCPCPRGDKTQFHTTSLAAGCTAAWLCVEKTVPPDAMLEEYRSTGQDGAFIVLPDTAKGCLQVQTTPPCGGACA